MGADSKIQWTHSTFNPWRGCTKVSPGCANCYADAMSSRNPKTLGVWGPNGTRVVASEAMWREPLKWDKTAAKAGERRRVFCASLADVFEDWQGPIVNSDGHPLVKIDKRPWTIQVHGERPITMNDVRQRLFGLIDSTPNLDWLLLTKRPENIAKMMPPFFPGGYIAEAGRMNQEGERPNLWLGTSIENQEQADKRIPHLLNVPAKVRFLSVEPLLGPIDLTKYSVDGHYVPRVHTGIDWVIVGGESGPHARPCNLGWIRNIVQQCKAAGVACFVKQLGAKPIFGGDFEKKTGPMEGLRLRDPKGGDWSEWPEDLRVREIPK